MTSGILNYFIYMCYATLVIGIQWIFFLFFLNKTSGNPDPEISENFGIPINSGSAIFDWDSGFRISAPNPKIPIPKVPKSRNPVPKLPLIFYIIQELL